MTNEKPESLLKAFKDAFKKGKRLPPTQLLELQKNISTGLFEGLSETISAEEYYRWAIQTSYDAHLLDKMLEEVHDIYEDTLYTEEDQPLPNDHETMLLSHGDNNVILSVDVREANQYGEFIPKFKELLKPLLNQSPYKLFESGHNEVKIIRDLTSTQIRTIATAWLKAMQHCFDLDVVTKLAEQRDKLLRLFPVQATMVLMDVPTGFVNIMVPDAQNFRNGGNQYRCLTYRKPPKMAVNGIASGEALYRKGLFKITEKLFSFYKGKRIPVEALKGEYIWMVPNRKIDSKTINAMLDYVDELTKEGVLFAHQGWVKPFFVLTAYNDLNGTEVEEGIYMIETDQLYMNVPAYRETEELFLNNVRVQSLPNAKTTYARRRLPSDRGMTRVVKHFDLI